MQGFSVKKDTESGSGRPHRMYKFTVTSKPKGIVREKTQGK